MLDVGYGYDVGLKFYEVLVLVLGMCGSLARIPQEQGYF
jgi:hypothetical protein